MPSYEYACVTGHRTEAFRKISERHDTPNCVHCGAFTSLIISRTHCPPDGVYSYSPNLGDATAFDRRWENLKARKRLSDGSE